jgi:hypothetical protein
MELTLPMESLELEKGKRNNRNSPKGGAFFDSGSVQGRVGKV